MMLMAQAFGADAQLVAFMQYMRVVFVATSAALVARFWLGISGGGPAMVWFPPLDPLRLRRDAGARRHRRLPRRQV